MSFTEQSTDCWGSLSNFNLILYFLSRIANSQGKAVFGNDTENIKIYMYTGTLYIYT
jgi:hypothetical protein